MEQQQADEAAAAREAALVGLARVRVQGLEPGW